MNKDEEYLEDVVQKDVKRWVVYFVTLIIALILINSTKVITYPSNYSVIKQFGEIVRVVKTEDTAYGLTFKLPIIQSKSSISREMQFYDISPSEVMTADKKKMIADCFVLWKVTDPKLYTQKLSASRSTTEARINTTVYNSMKTTMSAINQEDIISNRDGELPSMLLKGIGNKLETYGIEIVAIETKMIDLPDENKESVYARMISERNNISATYKAQGEQKARQIMNNTTQKVTVILANANRDADKLIAEGDAGYMKIMSDAYNDESKASFYVFVRQLDAMKASFKDGNDTIVLDKSSPVAQMFYGIK